MAEYTYKDVIIDPEDPRVEIGKEYWFSVHPAQCISNAEDNIPAPTLKDVVVGSNYPFVTESDSRYTCIIRKKEPVKKWVPFDFDDPEVRRELMGKTIVNNYGLDGEGEFREVMIVGFMNRGDEDADDYSSNGYTERTIVMTIDGYFHADEFLKECTFLDGTPCGKLVEE